MDLHTQSLQGSPSAETAHDSVIHTTLLFEMPFNVQGSIKSETVLLFKCHLTKAGNTNNLFLEQFYSNVLLTDGKAFSSSQSLDQVCSHLFP